MTWTLRKCPWLGYAVVLLVGGAVGIGAAAVSALAQSRPQQYKVERLLGSGEQEVLEATLNATAAQGWRFHSIHGRYIIFERK